MTAIGRVGKTRSSLIRPARCCAARVVAGALAGVEFHAVRTGHSFHTEDPRGFVRIVEDLAARTA